MFQNYYYLSESGVNFSREAYNFWDLIGEIAGIYELMVAFFGLILYTVARHYFVLNGISNLFLINTKDPDFIDSSNVDKKEEKIH